MLFSKGFYRRLLCGKTIGEAFEESKSAVSA